MPTGPFRTLVCAACLIAASIAPAALASERAPLEPPPAADPPLEPGDAPGVTVFAPTRRPAREEFATRLRELSAQHALVLASLRERLAAALSAERPAIQRDIESSKRVYEQALVQLQLDRANGQGRASLAAKLERRLAAIRATTRDVRAGARGGAR